MVIAKTSACAQQVPQSADKCRTLRDEKLPIGSIFPPLPCTPAIFLVPPMCTTIHSALNSQTIDDDEESEEELAINLEVTFIFTTILVQTPPLTRPSLATFACACSLPIYN